MLAVHAFVVEHPCSIAEFAKSITRHVSHSPFSMCPPGPAKVAAASVAFAVTLLWNAWKLCSGGLMMCEISRHMASKSTIGHTHNCQSWHIFVSQISSALCTIVYVMPAPASYHRTMALCEEFWASLRCIFAWVWHNVACRDSQAWATFQSLTIWWSRPSCSCEAVCGDDTPAASRRQHALPRHMHSAPLLHLLKPKHKLSRKL